MKPELEIQQTDQPGQIIDSNNLLQTVEVKQELDFEMFDGTISSENVNIKVNKVDSMDKKMIEANKVEQPKDEEICSCSQGSLTDTCVGAMQTQVNSLDISQHSNDLKHKAFPALTLEHKRNTKNSAASIGDECLVTRKNATEWRQNETNESENVMDHQIMAVEYSITQNDYSVVLHDGDISPEGEFCVSENSIQPAVNENGSSICFQMQSDGRKPVRKKICKCDVCGIAFKGTWQLKRHQVIHTGEKPYKCDVCGIGFNGKEHLQRHTKIHTGEKPYKCDICNAGFIQSGHFKRHVRKHTGEKPYKCDICNAEFVESGHLKTHMRIHTGEKPYKCDVCGVEFTNSGTLSKHKIIHTGKKPYKCNTCSLAFTQSSSLKKHMRKHTGEKPYKCDVCGLGFTDGASLKKHKVNHDKKNICD